jgi:hypothetical protein
MNSSSANTVLGFLALALTACGGADFTAFADDGEAAGAAGAAGDVDPGSGGSTAAGSGGESGTGSPAGSGGSVPVGGAAGDAGVGAGGSGAAGEAGSPSGGAAGAAGSPPGGAAGSGGAGPSCLPEEAITSANFPETFTWDGFSARYDDVDQSYCASSPGATCTLRNVDVTFYDEGALTVRFYLTCQPAFSAGVCGSEAPCATTINQMTQASTVGFSASPSGAGYRLTGGSLNPPSLLNPGACHTELPNGQGFAAPSDDGHTDLIRDLEAWLESLSFPCP